MPRARGGRFQGARRSSSDAVAPPRGIEGVVRPRLRSPSIRGRLSTVQSAAGALTVLVSCARAPAPAPAARTQDSASPSPRALAPDREQRGATTPGSELSGPTPVAVPHPSSAGPYKVATFNAGLAVGVVRYASERAPLVIAALATADVDLMCLQEIWLDAHWNELVSAARARFPAAIRLEPTLASLEPRCTQGELAPLRACARASCPRLASDQLAACVIQRCAQVAERVSVDCANCVARNPSGTLETITEACVDPRDGKTPRLGARGGMVAYGGSYGLGLLTRSQIVDRDVLRFRSVLNPRGVLYAKVAASAGELHVFCTHLTPDIAGLSHPTGGSWRHDHQVEVDGLLAFIAEKTHGAGPTLLLGDLNAGPTVGRSIVSPLTEDYQRLVAAGFANPYAASGRAVCTFCNANPMLGGVGTGGSLIDHILVRDVDAQVTVDPFLSEPISVPVGTASRRAAYSDHYGLRAVLQPHGALTPRD